METAKNEVVVKVESIMKKYGLEFDSPDNLRVERGIRAIIYHLGDSVLENGKEETIKSAVRTAINVLFHDGKRAMKITDRDLFILDDDERLILSQLPAELLGDLGFSFCYKNDYECETHITQRIITPKYVSDAYMNSQYKDFFEKTKNEMDTENQVIALFDSDVLVAEVTKKIKKTLTPIRKKFPKYSRLELVKEEIEKSIAEWIEVEIQRVAEARNSMDEFYYD